MAPFLVILLLLALGAGIVAWHTTGSTFERAKRRPAPAAKARAPSAAHASPPSAPPPPEEKSAPEISVFPATVPRANDPFANAPPLDTEHRP